MKFRQVPKGWKRVYPTQESISAFFEEIRNSEWFKEHKLKYMATKTLGEARVRTDFNVGGSSVVDEIKKNSAALINSCTEIGNLYRKKITLLRDEGKDLPSDDEHWNKIKKMEDETGELYRLISLAQTQYEQAAMWAVKAATFG